MAVLLIFTFEGRNRGAKRGTIRRKLNGNIIDVGLAVTF